MKIANEVFYKQSILLEELDRTGVLEIAYDGNIGIHELIKFYGQATPKQIKQLEFFLKTNQIPKVLNLLARVTGTRLVK